MAEPVVRQNLDLLSELGLLRTSYERDGGLRAVPPEIGMELLMGRQKAEPAAQQARIESSRVAAAQLIAEFAELGPATSRPGIEQLLGLDQVRDRLAALSHGLDHEVMTFAPGGGHRPESIAAAKPHDQDLLARGVRMRTVYLDSARNSQPTVEYVAWLVALGGEVRTTPEPASRMIIFDRRCAVIPVNSDDTAAGAVVLTGQGTLTALCALQSGMREPSRTPIRAHRSVMRSTVTASPAAGLRRIAAGLADSEGVRPRGQRRGGRVAVST
ncbi:helix-turn-helix transcriptional regulator [Kitasatospora purpeofusca]|uniref:helix-turn-helix transcriptional regulator n=1 Tax=Kitasatospora purpeofusca TaxID=67352 RepID=UPI0036E9F0A3